MKDAHDFVFTMTGPILPYDIRFSSMITTKNNKVVLVGGSSFFEPSNLDTFLELDSVTSKWKDIKLPIEKLRACHIAFKATSEQMEIFCGKYN